jgi:hypothetical protein
MLPEHTALFFSGKHSEADAGNSGAILCKGLALTVKWHISARPVESQACENNPKASPAHLVAPLLRCELDLKAGELLVLGQTEREGEREREPERKIVGPKWVHQLEGQVKPDEWRVFFYSQGNNVLPKDQKNGGFSSCYLELCNAQLLMGGRDVEFRLKVANHKDGSTDFTSSWSKHCFTESSRDWGFRHFLPLEDLENAASGFIGANGRISIELEFKAKEEEE